MKIMHINDSYRWERDRSMAGFSFVELIIVLAIVGVVCAFAVTSISRSRSSIRLQNSARLFASYAEKARVDAIKRHEGTNIDITGPSSYAITMDFDGSGVTSRTFTLEPGVVFTDSSNAPYTIDVSGNVSSPNGEPVSATDFNWRGRTSQCSMLFRLQNSNSERSVVQVAGSGDVTIDSVTTTPGSVTVTSMNSNDVASSSVLSGTWQHYELNPCSVNNGGGTSIPPPTATCVGGLISSDIGSVSVRKNGGSTATVNITVTGPGTIYAAPNLNLQVTPSSQSVSASNGGTFSFTIKSVTKTRSPNPPFTVVFNNPCNSVTVYVTVTN
jgi:prepilin-type N-terminal cleavage/methylation domain-containing protein